MKLSIKPDIQTNRSIEELPSGTIVDFGYGDIIVLLDDDLPGDPTCVAAMDITRQGGFKLSFVAKEHKEPTFKVIGQMEIDWSKQ